MEIINIENYKEERFHTSVALGNFDGVHIGHEKLISIVVEQAKKLNQKPSIMLFENHTRTLLEGRKQDLLTNSEQSIETLKDLGIEIIYKLLFDEKIRSLSPEDFVRKILVDKLNCKSVVVGFDYKFGYNASGDSKDLINLGKKYGFQVFVIEPVYIGDEIISSTKIRRFIRAGDLNSASSMLGKNYKVKGKIVPGKHLGSKIGFPTANISLLETYVIPKHGVYATNIKIDGKTYLSATSVSYNPTFNENKLKMETHIMDFNEDIYGKIIELEFLYFLRSDIKFNSIEELKNQIANDIREIESKH